VRGVIGQPGRAAPATISSRCRTAR